MGEPTLGGRGEWLREPQLFSCPIHPGSSGTHAPLQGLRGGACYDKVRRVMVVTQTLAQMEMLFSPSTQSVHPWPGVNKMWQFFNSILKVRI